MRATARSSVAARVAGDGLARWLDVFSQRSVRHGGRVRTAEDVRGESGMRLYRAVADEQSILAKDGQPDHRVAVDLG
ncbi:hypothetical protein ACWDBW_27720 [Streptomyces sp. NPDC001107]